jgi:hypothetical protein
MILPFTNPNGPRPNMPLLPSGSVEHHTNRIHLWALLLDNSYSLREWDAKPSH